jgi:hemerythrin-like domain-containing protein
MDKTLLPGPSADFDHPIDILDGCHERIKRQCATIQRIAAHLASQGPDEEARTAARAVIRYFDTAGADHHRDEEEDLFPALLHAVPDRELPATRALVHRLKADHVRLDAAWSGMRARLARLADAGEAARGAPGSQFLDVDAAREFGAAYDRHIALEETEMLPLARRVLDTRVLYRMGERMAERRGVRPSSGK